MQTMFSYYYQYFKLKGYSLSANDLQNFKLDPAVDLKWMNIGVTQMKTNKMAATDNNPISFKKL